MPNQNSYAPRVCFFNLEIFFRKMSKRDRLALSPFLDPNSCQLFDLGLNVLKFPALLFQVQVFLLLC